MQGPSELGARGKLAEWDRRADLSRIGVPTLTIGAAHDTMDPQQMAAMAKALPRGSHLHCPNGSHMAMAAICWGSMVSWAAPMVRVGT